MKRAIFINPPTGAYIRDDRCQVPVGKLSSALRMPLDLAYMAAILEKEGFTCVIRDYPAENKDWQDFKEDINNFKPNFLVISVTTPTLSKDLTACNIAKEIKKNTLTIAKGAHFIVGDIEAMNQCKDLDIVIRGECEGAIKELGQLKSLKDIAGITYKENGNIIRNKDRMFLDDIDNWPFPARHLLNNNLYKRPDTDKPMTSIQTNRGCPANCIFCLVKQTSGKKVISRLPASIAEEMVLCKKEYKIDNFYFRADTFTWDKEWVINVCKEIINRKIKFNWVANSRVDTLDEERIYWMKKAGCWMIGFGAESGDQHILDKIKKGITLQQIKTAVDLCSKFKVKTYLFWVLGLPWDNEHTLKNTIKFAKGLKSDFAEFHIAFPFPGTELYDFVLKNDLMAKKDLSEGDVKRAVTRTLFLPPERLRYYQRLATKSYYLNYKRIFRLLKGLSSPRVFINYCRKAFIVLR